MAFPWWDNVLSCPSINTRRKVTKSRGERQGWLKLSIEEIETVHLETYRLRKIISFSGWCIWWNPINLRKTVQQKYAHVRKERRHEDVGTFIISERNERCSVSGMLLSLFSRHRKMRFFMCRLQFWKHFHVPKTRQYRLYFAGCCLQAFFLHLKLQSCYTPRRRDMYINATR